MKSVYESMFELLDIVEKITNDEEESSDPNNEHKRRLSDNILVRRLGKIKLFSGR